MGGRWRRGRGPRRRLGSQVGTDDRPGRAQGAMWACRQPPTEVRGALHAAPSETPPSEASRDHHGDHWGRSEGDRPAPAFPSRKPDRGQSVRASFRSHRPHEVTAPRLTVMKLDVCPAPREQQGPPATRSTASLTHDMQGGQGLPALPRAVRGEGRGEPVCGGGHGSAIAQLSDPELRVPGPPT